ncbi:hypothetical protein H8F23_17440 [Pseudomonas sp. P155]|uniref:Uncharacterized protein n=1 Tax=Pseudomonas neuropathica TaxID=2730425 RepID=A0ABS0BKR2_9PSED|nr:hypothetical protein [Pseudomonas neuropathica]MBF6035036.1 hypothetical protein [Pseudomonas neuropathica]
MNTLKKEDFDKIPKMDDFGWVEVALEIGDGPISYKSRPYRQVVDDYFYFKAKGDEDYSQYYVMLRFDRMMPIDEYDIIFNHDKILAATDFPGQGQVDYRHGKLILKENGEYPKGSFLFTTDRGVEVVKGSFAFKGEKN